MSNACLVTNNTLFSRVFRFIKRDTVLVIAAMAAFSTMFFIPPSKAYFGYFDWKVLACLFCLMAIVAGLKASGLFGMLASSVLRFAGTTRSLATVLIATTFFLSMAITNDVALITLVPFALIMMRETVDTYTRATILTLQTIAANIGSSLTPVGNPQNLYIFSFFQMTPGMFFKGIASIVFAGGIMLALSIFAIPQRKLIKKHGGGNFSTKPFSISAYLILFVLAVLAVFHILDYRVVSAIVVAGIVLIDRRLFISIDYSLLFTFAFFFVFIGNLQHIESVKNILNVLVGKNVVLASLLASQAISNVPAAILLSHFTADSVALLRGVSIGGMGTIIASLASVITHKYLTHEYPAESLRYLCIFSAWSFSFLAILYLISLVV